ncbi:chlorophyll a-b binding 8, chloroplastic [Olea europaea subsp. europaea]|uniref:Chlorophyll a-b binding protein, chloroplastic n=1 Tax=Olea europaea subsp. europaea TaxID=158383 RepID=A0A8S0VB09_OLEEU|nr:chlorophyll a-b binding 8, chloroplastic [Olea europaea subsp. europaea]
MATQALLSSPSISSSAEVARQILGGRPVQSARKVSFVVKAASTPPVKQGADRPLWFASKQSLSYLDGSLPGDYGFDPLGLSDPEGTGGFIEPKWLAYGEIFNGRCAMVGAIGAIAPEILGKAGLIPAETALPWFKTGVIPPAGTYNYWADSYTLFVFELALVGFAEHRRFQDWANPGSMGKQYFLGLEKWLGGSGDPAYPGGPLFNPLGFGKDEKSMKELKVKEVKNGRLAMLAILGYFVQALVTGRFSEKRTQRIQNEGKPSKGRTLEVSRENDNSSFVERERERQIYIYFIKITLIQRLMFQFQFHHCGSTVLLNMDS